MGLFFFGPGMGFSGGFRGNVSRPGMARRHGKMLGTMH